MRMRLKRIKINMKMIIKIKYEDVQNDGEMQSSINEDDVHWPCIRRHCAISSHGMLSNYS